MRLYRTTQAILVERAGSFWPVHGADWDALLTDCSISSLQANWHCSIRSTMGRRPFPFLTTSEKDWHRNYAKANNGCGNAPLFDERSSCSAARTFYPQLLFPPGTINNF